MNETKLCRDCRWMVRSPLVEHDEEMQFARCTHPNVGVSLVSGMLLRSYCTAQRAETGGCGKSGAWWEAKETS